MGKIEMETSTGSRNTIISLITESNQKVATHLSTRFQQIPHFIDGHGISAGLYSSPLKRCNDYSAIILGSSLKLQETLSVKSFALFISKIDKN